MARDKTDRTDLTPVATSGTKGQLVWDKKKLAEDELSILWQETAKVETSEQAAQADLAMQQDDFWQKIESLADECDAILTENKFPRAYQTVRHDGAGDWWLHPTDAPKAPPSGETWKFINGGAFAQENASDLSELWYAGRLGLKCRLALEHYRKANTGEPFLYLKIFEIATLRTNWRWWRSHKP
jgi:hypothetical protein